VIRVEGEAVLGVPGVFLIVYKEEGSEEPS
jgi:hypothetical protein